MAKTMASSGTTTGEKMAPPSITLRPDKRSPTNCHTSPARTGRTTPTSMERKPQINGHASPSHTAAPNVSNNHAVLEGYMRTDDRMRLAKERREERERSLVAREQLIREKERRARLQYERTVEERWKRLEEQRQREELRRAAVEEKRRQQLEEERGRFEALMKRSLERSLQLEQRAKRWGKAGPTGVGDSENAPLPHSAASAFSHGIASPLPAVSESAPCSPHRSPFCTSLNPADHSRAVHQGGSQSTPNTPKKERLRRDRRTASPGCASPVRRSESPASVSKYLASPATSKLASKMRTQSPSNAHQYHYSPTRRRPNLPTDDGKAEDKKVEKPSEQPKQETAVKKNTKNDSMDPTSQAEKNVLNAEVTKHRSSRGETSIKHLKSDVSEKDQSSDRKEIMCPNVDSSEKKMQGNARDGDKKKESALCTSTAKMAAGTANADEAARLLAERRRQARAQKEQEDKQQELKDEERQREEEQPMKQVAQEQRQQGEGKAQRVEETGKHEEDPCSLKQEEDKRKKEDQEKELLTLMDKEREKAKIQAQEGVDRQRQNRELLTQQEEEERQLRKKRIEEIMKRTRKGEVDLKNEEQVETRPVSPPGKEKTVQSNAQVSKRAIKRVEFQVKEQVSGQEAAGEAVGAATAQMDYQGLPVMSNTHQVTRIRCVSDKKTGTKQTSQEHDSRPNKEAKASILKQQGREEEMNVNKQHRANIKVTDQLNEECTQPAVEAMQSEAGMTNGARKCGRSVSMSSHPAAYEASKQQILRVSTAEGKAKGGSKVEVTRPSPTPLLMGHFPLPIMELEPLDVKDGASCDEVQSMEVSPASKEELISIPEFSPVCELQHRSMSNTRALEDLMDLTGGIPYPKLSYEDNIGNCNKNLIEGVVSPVSDSTLIGRSPPSSNKLRIK